MLPGPRQVGRASYDARVRRLITLVCALVVCDLALWSAIVPLLPYYRRQLDLTTLQVGWMLAAFSVAVVLVASAGEELVTLLLECVVGVLAWVGELLLHAASSKLAAMPRAAVAMVRGC